MWCITGWYTNFKCSQNFKNAYVKQIFEAEDIAEVLKLLGRFPKLQEGCVRLHDLLEPATELHK